MRRVGLISDTHGLLRPAALAFLQSSDFIVHGGDIGDPAILEALGAIAPVTAVRGNNDRAGWALALPEIALLEVGALRIGVVHDLADPAFDAAASGVHVVVCGHSHKPMVQQRDGVLYVNPGSAGPRRFRLPIAVGELIVEGGRASPRIELLEEGG